MLCIVQNQIIVSHIDLISAIHGLLGFVSVASFFHRYTSLNCKLRTEKDVLSGTGCGLLNGTCCLGLAVDSMGRVVWDWLRAQWDVLSGTGCGLNGTC